MNDTETAPAPETPPHPEAMPGLDLAYGFVQPSYQWALARFEAGDGRLQTLHAVIAGVSLPVPAFAKLVGGLAKGAVLSP